MKLRLLLGAVAGLLILSVTSLATQASAQISGNCGGNQTVQPAPLTCDSSRTFTFGALQRTVSVHLVFNADGSATASYTVDKTVPQDFQLRVRSHAGISSTPGNLVDDKSAVFPANSLGPVVISFTFDCGQIDVKAVFVAPGDQRGRVAGPYVCKPVVVPPTTTPTTTVPGQVTTVPAGVDATSTTPSSVASQVSGPLPATGNGPTAFEWSLIVLGLGSFLLVVVHLSRRPSTA